MGAEGYSPGRGPEADAPGGGWARPQDHRGDSTPSTRTPPPVAARRRRGDPPVLGPTTLAQPGRVARCAAQLLKGAAAMPSVETAKTEQHPQLVAWSARQCPARPSTARDVSAQLACSASHHLARSLVDGEERRLAGEQSQHRGAGHHQRGELPMKNTPSTWRQDAPVPGAAARSRGPGLVPPGPGLAAQNEGELAEQLAASSGSPPGQQEAEEDQPEQVAVPLDAPGQVGPALRLSVRWFSLVFRPGIRLAECVRISIRRSATGTAGP